VRTLKFWRDSFSPTISFVSTRGGRCLANTVSQDIHASRPASENMVIVGSSEPAGRAVPLAVRNPSSNGIFRNFETGRWPRTVVRDLGRFQGGSCSAGSDVGTTPSFSHIWMAHSGMNVPHERCIASDSSPARPVSHTAIVRLVCAIEGRSLDWIASFKRTVALR
jgi:hypothetical protein